MASKRNKVNTVRVTSKFFKVIGIQTHSADLKPGLVSVPPKHKGKLHTTCLANLKPEPIERSQVTLLKAPKWNVNRIGMTVQKAASMSMVSVILAYIQPSVTYAHIASTKASNRSSMMTFSSFEKGKSIMKEDRI